MATRIRGLQLDWPRNGAKQRKNAAIVVGNLTSERPDAATERVSLQIQKQTPANSPTLKVVFDDERNFSAVGMLAFHHVLSDAADLVAVPREQNRAQTPI
jgi:hypothetical protein